MRCARRERTLFALGTATQLSLVMVALFTSSSRVPNRPTGTRVHLKSSAQIVLDSLAQPLLDSRRYERSKLAPEIGRQLRAAVRKGWSWVRHCDTHPIDYCHDGVPRRARKTPVVQAVSIGWDNPDNRCLSRFCNEKCPTDHRLFAPSRTLPTTLDCHLEWLAVWSPAPGAGAR